jgi:DNA-binding XRE family transcriptional regulator
MKMDTPKTEPAQHANENKRAARDEEHAPHEAAATTDEGKRADAVATKSSVRAKQRGKNNVRKLRMERMMSKAELARRAGLSTLTIDRVEKGMACRMDTKRKILEALGLTPSDRVKVFGDDD